MIKVNTRRPIKDIAQDFLVMAKDPKKGDIPNKIEKLLKQALPKQQTDLLVFLKSNLDKILVGTPSELEELVQNAKKYPAFKRKAKKLVKSLNAIFNYKLFTTKGSQRGWNAYWLANQLGVDTCPYCNRLYTHTVTNEKGSISRPQFDHFFNKATYPFLAVSFYNLIPSCSICNSTLKGKKEFTIDTHVHPYLDGFGNEVRFNLQINDSSFFAGNLEAGKIDLVFSKQNSLTNRAQNNIRDFKLLEIYANHIDYAHEQVNRALVYNEDYLDNLFRQFEGSLFRTRDELIRFIVANYTEDWDLQNRPLSKLTKDIAIQFGLD